MTNRFDRAGSGGGGFSLLEMMAVIVIIGILSSVVIPSMQKYLENVRLRTAIDVVRNQLMAAKMRAVANPDIHCGVHFDTAGGRTFLFQDRSVGARYRFVAGEDTVYLGAADVPAKTKLQIPSSGGITNCAVVFRGDGSAKYGGAVEVLSTVSASKKRRLVVNALVGRVKVVTP